MSKLRSRGAVSGAMAAAALVASVVFAPQASAGIYLIKKNESGQNCTTSTPVGSVCVWRDAGYSGDYYYSSSDGQYREGGLRFSEGNLTQNSLYNNSNGYVAFQNDRISSVKVRLYNRSMCFYEHPNFGGKELKVGWDDVSNMKDKGMNDRISSFRPC